MMKIKILAVLLAAMLMLMGGCSNREEGESHNDEPSRGQTEMQQDDEQKEDQEPTETVSAEDDGQNEEEPEDNKEPEPEEQKEPEIEDNKQPEPEKQKEPEPEDNKQPETQGNNNTSSRTSAYMPSGDDFLLLVNPQHTLPEGFDIELSYVQGEYRVDTRIVETAKQMIADAAAEGVNLLVCSAYRPVDSQTRLFNNKVAEYMAAGRSEEDAYALTSTIIAIPGTSEHHTGLAMDIVTPAYQGLDDGFENTSAFKWLDAHAAEYGFILRYPKDKQEITQIIYEPWHYRYVGAEVAKEIKAAGICLEEYLGAD